MTDKGNKEFIRYRGTILKKRRFTIKSTDTSFLLTAMQKALEDSPSENKDPKSTKAAEKNKDSSLAPKINSHVPESKNFTQNVTHKDDKTPLNDTKRFYPSSAPKSKGSYQRLFPPTPIINRRATPQSARSSGKSQLAEAVFLSPTIQRNLSLSPTRMNDKFYDQDIKLDNFSENNSEDSASLFSDTSFFSESGINSDKEEEESPKGMLSMLVETIENATQKMKTVSKKKKNFKEKLSTTSKNETGLSLVKSEVKSKDSFEKEETKNYSKELDLIFGNAYKERISKDKAEDADNTITNNSKTYGFDGSTWFDPINQEEALDQNESTPNIKTPNINLQEESLIIDQDIYDAFQNHSRTPSTIGRISDISSIDTISFNNRLSINHNLNNSSTLSPNRRESILSENAINEKYNLGEIDFGEYNEMSFEKIQDDASLRFPNLSYDLTQFKSDVNVSDYPSKGYNNDLSKANFDNETSKSDFSFDLIKNQGKNIENHNDKSVEIGFTNHEVDKQAQLLADSQKKASPVMGYNHDSTIKLENMSDVSLSFKEDLGASNTEFKSSEIDKESLSKVEFDLDHDIASLELDFNTNDDYLTLDTENVAQPNIEEPTKMHDEISKHSSPITVELHTPPAGQDSSFNDKLLADINSLTNDVSQLLNDQELDNKFFNKQLMDLSLLFNQPKKKILPNTVSLLNTKGLGFKSSTISFNGSSGKGLNIYRSADGLEVPNLPNKLLKHIAEQTLNTSAGKVRLAKESFSALHRATFLYFQQTAQHLAYYSKHAGRKTIDVSDVELLLLRQGYLSDKQNITLMLHRTMPRELVDPIEEEIKPNPNEQK